MFRRFSFPALILPPFLLFSAAAACPYDMTYVRQIIPSACYANATTSAAAAAPSPSSAVVIAPATSCCWFVFASYLYIAIRYANSTGVAFLLDPTATDCTKTFTSYVLREGIASPSLLSGQRCNLVGDPVKFVAGSGPCQFRNVSDIVAETNVSDARSRCSGGPPSYLNYNQTACMDCQSAVETSVFGLLDATKSSEFVACGLAATIGIWSPSLPEPGRFTSYTLCMVQVLENVGNLGTGNFFPTSASPPQSSPTIPFPSTGGGPSKKIIAAALVSAGIFLSLAATFCLVITISRKRRRRKWRSTVIITKDDDSTAVVNASPLPTEGLYIFSKSELKQATNGYDPKLLLGEGGAGKVYLGKIPSGQNVAIKRILKKKKLGEFYKEVEILAKLRHRNLTTLLGYCLQAKEHVLVSEYMPGGNLSKALYHGKLSWHHRVRIAVDIAEGLSYLHEFPEGAVVHRDVKPTNVLLTESGQAKLSDFGVSRIVPAEITHVSTEVKGTRGYVDPEYFSAGQMSESTDVYSYGIVLLELVTGLKAIVSTPSGGLESIVHTAHAVMTAAAEAGGGGEGGPYMSKVVDPRLGVDWDQATVAEVFKLAYQCVKPYKNERPRMKEVLAVLKRVLAELDGRIDSREAGMDGGDEEGDELERSSPSGKAISDAPFTSPSVQGLSL